MDKIGKNMKELKRSKDFDKMIVEAVQGNFSFFVWHSDGEIVVKCELKVKAYRKDYNEIELEFRPEQKEALSKIVSGNRIVNVYIPDLSVSFSSHLKSISPENRMKILPPEEYSFHERRKHDRLQPAKTCYMAFEINKAVMKKSIYDISIGGLAIILPKSDKVNIVKGRMFPLVFLEIEGRKMKLKAECVNTVSIDRYKLDDLPYGGYKIAFRFAEISLEDKAFLTEYVTHQMLLKLHIKKAN